MKKTNNLIKYLTGLLTVVGMRLIPHPPNVEPIMSTMMPFSKKWGWLSGMLFCLISVVLFDVLSGIIGVWTLVTAGTYSLVGAFSGLYFKNRESKIKNYVKFSIIATIFYDAVTGIGMGMLFFNQSFITTFLGQIPFTLYHLTGNILLAIIVSPALYKRVVNNPNFETNQVFNKILPVFQKNTNR
ncbi:hypothetical protein K0B04_00410 [Patescibacteria group bacterium]|nr:hypothetical protein [Patescibacteria group bacterium]